MEAEQDTWCGVSRVCIGFSPLSATLRCSLLHASFLCLLTAPSPGPAGGFTWSAPNPCSHDELPVSSPPHHAAD